MALDAVGATIERERPGRLDVAALGQVFTPPAVVAKMLALRRNRGRTLEPSCGDGAFSSRITGCVAIEFDARVAPQGARVMDFFDFPATEVFDTIIGNPPYVRFQDIGAATRAKLDMQLFDARSNLSLFFIEKCLRHLAPGGELIFIVPRDFIKATAARKLNRELFEQGTITDFIDLGDARVFDGALPNTAIFRFEKGRMDRRMHDGRLFDCHNGQLVFLGGDYTLPFASLFSVKVGAVSGRDEVFAHADGNVDFVCSKTATTGETRRMIYDVQHPHLVAHKDALLARRIRHFDEDNWWHWGRDHHKSDAPRIYVNCKTRQAKPFFVHDCKDYDGSVLAIFPRDAGGDVRRAAELLNAVDWAELGFVCDGRFLFAQRALESCFLPADFARQLAAR
ncbi:class I SAM-dependent methyltransferase [Uliginosibacterium sp. H3]|uniref:site-specific DNA-methyltransferase (adenine-specific) n=1 Tax=Uliginosibacterium silvisoli TaxID=3114758 RepID=A0ABU6K138_9RHOO|nr:class I SAM-dependent methyltransferase [Uliginosibacterium sp. H3]